MATRTIEYTFDEIYNSLKDRAIAKGLVTDAAFEGSNISLLIDILAYNTQISNTNTTLGIREMIPTMGQERENVLLSNRTMMGYEAQYAESFQYKLSLRPKTYGVYTIPKYAEFTSGSKTYYNFAESIINREFNYTVELTVPSTTVVPTSGTASINLINSSYYNSTLTGTDLVLEMDFDSTITYAIGDTITVAGETTTITNVTDNRVIEMIVKEGTLHTPTSDTALTKTIQTVSGSVTTYATYVDVDYTNIESSGIELLVPIVASTNFTLWTKRDSLIVNNSSDSALNTFVQMLNIDDETTRVHFTYAGTGTLPSSTTVDLNILVSSGSSGAADVSNFVIDNDTLTSADFSLTVDAELIKTGTDVETTESVRENGVLWKNTGGRCVVPNDFIAVANQQSNIDQTSPWGGDTESPIRLGHLFFSFLPSYRNTSFTTLNSGKRFSLDLGDSSSFFLTDDEYISTSVDSNGKVVNPGIFDILEDYKIMTLIMHKRAPVFLDFDIGVEVLKYNATVDVQNADSAIFNVIKTYFNSTIEKFDSSFFMSTLTKKIDTILGDDTGINMTLNTSITFGLEHANIPISSNPNIAVNEGDKTFVSYIGVPFEDMYDTSDVLNKSALPIIDTENFLGTDDLTVDFDISTPSTIEIGSFITFAIIIGGVQSGEYRVSRLGNETHIRLELWYADTGSSVTSSITTATFPTMNPLTVSYTSPNMKVFRNTIPRLNNVTFV